MGDFSSVNSRKTGATLRLLATTDMHAHMTGWDACQNRTSPGLGLDRLAVTIRRARATAPGQTLLLDNGDVLQGTAEADACAQPGSAIAHPWPAIANALGYDAVGLGNHDFDYGLDYLESITGMLNAPVLCASLSRGQIEGVVPWTLVPLQLDCEDRKTRPIAVGIFSVLPPQTVMWNQRKLADHLDFDTGTDAARRSVKHLRRSGADLVVALCHSGLSTDVDPGTENFAYQVARTVAGIDAMIMGHTHRRFPDTDDGISAWIDHAQGTVAGVPAVMPDFAAQSLGIIDLDLIWDAGAWRVRQHSVQLAQAPRNETEPAITALAAPSIAATRDLMQRPVSETGHAIHSYFNALQSGTEHALTARAMMRTISAHVAGSELAELPVIASVSSAAVGGHGGVTNFINIPKGPILERHIAMLCPYQNDIWAAVLTGADLWNWAERAAAYFGPTEDTDSALANPAAPFFNFDTLIGLDTVVDPFAPPRFDPVGVLVDPAARRIRSLRWQGTEVTSASRFLVAMTSYRGAGGGGFPGLSDAETILQTPVDLASALRRDLQESPLGASPPDSAWRFITGRNRQVVIDTSPDAIEHLDDISRFCPTVLGKTTDGFLRIRVTI